MVTDSKETVEAKEETAGQASATETDNVPSDKPTDESSKEEEEERIPKSEVERRLKELEANLTSGKDKELKHLYTDLETAKKQLTEIQSQAEQEKQEAQLRLAEESERKQWVDLPENQVRDFQESRRSHEKEKAKIAEAYQAWQVDVKEKDIKYAETEAENDALKLYIRHFVPNGEEILNSPHLAEIRKGKDKSERELITIKRKYVNPEPPKKENHVPYNAINRAPLGKDTKKMSPSELINEGLKQSKK